MISGFINVYKEAGFTSHDVVAIIRKNLKGIKTGHTGTLDPDAEGVLPICIGKATKLAEYVGGNTKKYRATVKLGITTDTQDTSGNIISKKEVNCSKESIEKAVLSFLGEYNQIPPMYSALKVNGEKLYNLARKGKSIERKPRKIEIYNISILDFLSNDRFIIDVTCSKGTYIRTLCHDIGEKLGTGACMEYLIRTKTGNFELKDSIKLEDLKYKINANGIEDIIIPIDKVLIDYQKITAFNTANKYLYNGNKISINFIKNKENFNKEKDALLYDSCGNLIGIYKFIGNEEIKPIVMLADLT